jgi:hypothetical protein
MSSSISAERRAVLLSAFAGDVAAELRAIGAGGTAERWAAVALADLAAALGRPDGGGLSRLRLAAAALLADHRATAERLAAELTAAELRADRAAAVVALADLAAVVVADGLAADGADLVADDDSRAESWAGSVDDLDRAAGGRKGYGVATALPAFNRKRRGEG